MAGNGWWDFCAGRILVALPLSPPGSDWKSLTLTATFIVVMFSIIVQSLTIAPLAKCLRRAPDPL